MEINWGLLQPVDIGGNFTTGFQMGQQLVQKEKMKNALAAYAQDPTNPAAQSALAAVSPEFALHMGQTREAEAKTARERARIGSYFTDPNPAAARTRALQGGDITVAEQIGKLDDDQRKKLGDMYKGAAPLAYQALKLPYEQRRAYIESIKPQLKAAGWDDSHLDSFDPTDANLQGLVQSSMTLEQAMGRDKINYEPVPEGARLVPFDSFGRPTTNDTGTAHPPANTQPAAAASEVATILSTALPAPVVAGFLGNLDVEGGYGGAKGDGGAAAGIAQWHGERQANFERIIGKPISQATHGEQAKFILWEMQNPEAAGMTIAQRDAILAAKTPQEAAALIDQHYERSSGRARQQRVEAAGRHAGTNTEALMREQAQKAIASLPRSFAEADEGWRNAYADARKDDPNIGSFDDFIEIQRQAVLKRLNGSSSTEDSIRQHAQEAIAAGADPAAVRARAASMGVTL